MITEDFGKRTRARIAEARTVLTAFEDAYKTTVKQLAKIAKAHATDKGRVYDKLGEIAEDVVDKLPEETEQEDLDKAYGVKEKVHELAGAIEKIDIGESEIEELGSEASSDPIQQIFDHLKEAEKKLTAMERLATKLKI